MVLLVVGRFAVAVTRVVSENAPPPNHPKPAASFSHPPPSKKSQCAAPQANGAGGRTGRGGGDGLAERAWAGSAMRAAKEEEEEPRPPFSGGRQPSREAGGIIHVRLPNESDACQVAARPWSPAPLRRQ